MVSIKLTFRLFYLDARIHSYNHSMYYSIMQFIILYAYGKDDGKDYKVVRPKYFEKYKCESYIDKDNLSYSNKLAVAFYSLSIVSFVALILPP